MPKKNMERVPEFPDEARTLLALTKRPVLRRVPRGMLDRLAPQIYEAAKYVSLHEIRRKLESEHGWLVSVPSIAECLRRNKFVPRDPNPRSHNV